MMATFASMVGCHLSLQGPARHHLEENRPRWRAAAMRLACVIRNEQQAAALVCEKKVKADAAASINMERLHQCAESKSSCASKRAYHRLAKPPRIE